MKPFLKTSMKFFVWVVISTGFLVNLKLLVQVTRKKYNFVHGREKREIKAARGLGLNHHIWMEKALSIDFLCNIPLFPKAPNKRMIIDRLEFSRKSNENYVERIFGFLRPPETGRYVFTISSDDSSELWLSSSDKIEDSTRIAYVGEKGETHSPKNDIIFSLPSQISKEISLTVGKVYFMEVLHVNQAKNNHLTVLWKLPGHSEFSIIRKKFLKTFIPNDIDYQNEFYDYYIPPVISCKKTTFRNPFLQETHRHYASHEKFASVLSKCNIYSLSILHEGRNLSLSQFQSLTSRRFYKQTTVYPHELINAVGKDRGNLEYPIWENIPLEEKDAIEIVDLYMMEMEKQFNGYTLQSIISVKKTAILPNGSRYLLELNLTTPEHKTIYLSEYVYHDNNTLCYTDQWERDTLITFVVTVKNQGKWIHVLLDNMVDVIAATQDQNINIVIFDYESNDIDLEEAIVARGLTKMVKTRKKNGRYSRRDSFNLAVELVTDPHSIVFLLDLHLTMGEGLINDIRKHTIEGHLVYTPIIIRQWSDTTPHHTNSVGHYGFYETFGFGIVGIYKSDWDRIGGFDPPADQNATYKWGGEDYELMDRVCRQGLEYIRIKCPYVYHFSHTRDRMWDKSS